MSQWAHEHPDAMAEIAAAPLPRQNDLLADAARGIASREATRAHYDSELGKAKPTGTITLEQLQAKRQIEAIEQFDAELAHEQLTDWERRERGQQLLDHLDHTIEDLMTDQDDDTIEPHVDDEGHEVSR